LYQRCIFCSGALGGNEALEHFPVGRTLAFDAAKGRLWAVCGRCARWNLAPIEERWEAVEQAEKQFADARVRVQRENIGLARLADGTRLVRVGRAVPAEVAEWRYGAQMTRRRRIAGVVRNAANTRKILMLGVSLLVGVGVAPWAFFPTWTVLGLGDLLYLFRAERRVARVPRGEPSVPNITIRRRDLNGARLEVDESGALSGCAAESVLAGTAGRPV
jgi:hypothetical protein